jgi:dGTPase
MVRDVLAEANRRLTNARPTDVEAIRELGHPVVAFSDAMGQNDRALKEFLFENLYRGATVLQQTAAARQIVTELFEGLMAAPRLLPAEWREGCECGDQPTLARLVADYIAGMTDRYAKQRHAILVSEHC